MSLLKSSAARQKARLIVALASLNNGHNSDLRACCVGVRSSSRPSLVPARPLRPCSTTWQSSLIVNLSSTMSRCALAAGAMACVKTCHYYVVTTTLAHNFIWPCNNSMLSCCTNSFSVLPSFVLKSVSRRLSLRSSFLGTSARVSTTWLTTCHTFLVITVVHLGSSTNITLAVIAAIALHSIS